MHIQITKVIDNISHPETKQWRKARNSLSHMQIQINRACLVFLAAEDIHILLMAPAAQIVKIARTSATQSL